MNFLKRFFTILLLMCFFIAVFGTAYVIVARDRVFPAADTLVLYGRDHCGHTTAMRNRLSDEGVPFVYANIDAPLIDLEMWSKLGAFSGTVTRARLPVIELNGTIRQRPNMETIITEYRRASHQVTDTRLPLE